MSSLSVIRFISVVIGLFFCVVNPSFATYAHGYYPSYSSSDQGHWSGYGFAKRYHPAKQHKHHHYFGGHYNRAPMAYGKKVRVHQNESKSIRLFASDADGDKLHYYIVRSPRQGVLTGKAPNVVYTPRYGFSGWDRFKFKVSDGRKAGWAWVKIYVKRKPQNTAPIANDQSLTLESNATASITLMGSDADGDALSYTVLSQPAHGSLSGSAPNLVYTPNTDYVGNDQFTFRVNDGKQDSAIAKVSLRIEQTLTCKPQGATQLNYTSFADVSGFKLNGSAGLLTPNNDHVLRLTKDLSQGGSAFSKTAISLKDSQGFLASFSAAFSFQITQPIGISDADGQGADGLVFVLQTMANNVGANGGGIGYQGIKNSLGIEFDTWNNGDVDQHNGNHIGININGSVRSKHIKSINQRFNDGALRHVWVDYDGSLQQLEIRLSGQEQRPDTALLVVNDIELPWVLGKEHAFVGFSSGTGAAGGQHDILDFQFVNRYAPIDGCNNHNVAPVAIDQTLQTNQNTPLSVMLEGSDADGDPLTYVIETQPTNGVLSGTTPDLIYTPNTDYVGDDSFTFVVNDGSVNSIVAAVNIQTLAVNSAPTANNQSLVIDEDTQTIITLTGTDPENDVLNYTLLSQPTNGVLSGTAPNLSYVPNSNFVGNDSLTFQVNDGALDSAVATIDITVTPVNDAPIANDQSVVTLEDTLIPIQLTGSDSDGDTLTFTLVTPALNGLVTGTAPNLIYTPAPNFSGTDVLTFKVNDGNLDSNSATVSILVTSVNDAPIADAQNISTDEDVAVSIILTGSDTEGDALNYTVQTQPANGVLTGTAPNLTYTPTAGFNGNDSFAFVVNDGTVDSVLATVSITVNPVNDAPIADDQSVTTDEDVAATITLTGSDLEGDALSYTVQTQPANGTLSGTAPNLTYAPTAGFNGSDSFTFVVNDGTVDSNIATVSITINPINDAPTADDQSVATDEDVATTITLTGSDPEGDALTYGVQAQPSNGTLSGAAPSLTYTPNADFSGSDSFTFVVNDGTADSVVATVSITVNPVNDAPIADDQSITTDEDVAVAVALTSSDLEGDTLTYVIQTQPSNGVLSGTAPNLTYTPTAGFNGNDSFTFVVNDGTVDSNIATVSITINPINDAPTADDQSVATDEDVAATITLMGSDPEGDALTYTVQTQPMNGTLSGAVPNLTYMPNAGFNGNDSFTFVVNDGTVDSALATVSITVNPVNDAPTADDQAITTDEDVAASITLTGSDPEGDALTYTVQTQPVNGTLSGTAPDLTYTPNAGFNGIDLFTFTVNDSTLDSSTATVSITVNPVNDVPIADDQMISTDEDIAVAITLTGSDPEGDALTYVIQAQPSNGTLSGTAPDLTYTPIAGFNGDDSFTFVVNDGVIDSAVATISIMVNPVNDAPIADDQAIITDEDVAASITLTGSDPEGDALTYTVQTQPVNGTLTGTAPDLTYTPNTDFTGSDSFTFVINDGIVDSVAATVSITVNPINDAPIADDQSITTDEDVAVAIALTGSDPDGDALTYAVQTQPANGALTGTAPDVTYTPTAGFNGNDSFTFVVNDGAVDSAVATVSVMVNSVNSEPVIISTPIALGMVDQPYSYDVEATDADGDTLVYSLVNSPNGMTIDSATGLITWDAPVLGEFDITVSVNDGNGGEDQQTYLLIITENGPPITSQGTDFWLMFNVNTVGGVTDLARLVYITSQFDATVTIEIPGLGTIENYSVAAGTVETINLNDQSKELNHDQSGLFDGGIHVSSDLPVVVYLINRVKFTTDATSVLPTSALGKEYLVASYAREVNSRGSYFSAVATEDDTVISFTPKELFVTTTQRYDAGVEAQVTLNRGQTLQAVGGNSSDFSGMLLSSNKPIAAFSGSNCTSIVVTGYCDHLVEQLVPLKSWGAEYLSIPLAERQNGDSFRIYAAQDDTIVTINDEYAAILRAGDYYQTILPAASVIRSSYSVQVMQFSNSTEYDNVVSDPFMLTVPPVEQFVNNYILTTPESGFARNFINIIAPSATRSTVLVNGVAVDDTLWQNIEGSTYIGAQIPVPLGVHTVSADQPVGVYAYGFDKDDSYGYLGGMAFTGEQTPAQLEVEYAPQPAIIGEPACVKATVTDASASPIAQQQVAFTLNNSTLGITKQAAALTNVTGMAEYCWIRGVSSVDTVTVTAGGLTQGVNIDWQAYLGSENLPPIIESVPVMYAPLRDNYQYQVIAFDPNGDTLSYTLTEAPADMTISPDGGLIEWAVGNEFLEAWVTLEVSDPSGETARQRYRLVFNPDDNHYPIYSLPKQQIIAERNYAENWSSSVSDLDGDAITYSLLNGPTGFEIASNGRIAWLPTLADLGVHPISLLLEDARGGQTAVDYDLTVTENQSPVFTSDPPLNGRVGALLAYTVVATDADGDSVSYELVSAPDGMTLTSGRFLRWTPEAIQVGSFPVTIKAQDNFGGESLQNFVVEVSVNKAPEFTSTPSFSARVGLSYAYTLMAVDPDGDPVTYALTTAPDGMTLLSGRFLRWTPTANQLGEHEVVVQANDGKGGSSLQSYVLTVVENRAPEFTSIPVVSIVDSHNYSYQAVATDPDNDNVIYSLARFPDGMTLLSGRFLRWTPSVSQVGVHDVVILADDRKGGVTEQAYQITVTSNRAPEFTSVPNDSVIENHNYFYQVTAVDPDNDSVVYSLATAPDGMTLLSGRFLRWTPTSAQVGSHLVEVLADDRFGKTATQSFEIEVFANQAPQITAEPNTAGRAGVNYFSRVRATDPDGDGVQYRLISGPTNLTISNSGNISWGNADLILGTNEVVLEAFDQFEGVTEYRYDLTIIDTDLSITKAPNDQTIFDNELFQFKAEAIHFEGRGISYEFTESPDGATIVPNNGQIEWIPTATQLGTNVFTLRAFSSDGLEDTATFTITVEPNTNQTPVIVSSPVTTGQTGVSYEYQVEATDAENHALTYSLVNGPSGMRVNETSGVVSWAISNSATLANTYSVTVRVTDERGKFVEQTYDLIVSLSNVAPRITSQANTIAKIGFDYAYQVEATDANGDVLTYELSIAPANMTINNDGLIQWKPTEVGVFTVELVVTDGEFTDVQLFQVAVNPTLPALSAVVSLDPPIVNADENVRVNVGAQNNSGTAFARVLVDGVEVANRATPFTWFVSSPDSGVHTVEVIIQDTYESVTTTNSFRVRDPGDATAPVAIITNITDNQTILAPIDVIGTVDDGNLASWQLILKEKNTPPTEFQVIAEGTENFTEDVMTTFDPTLVRNGQYAFILLAIDLNGLETQTSVSFMVDEDLKVGNFSVTFEDLNIPLAGIPISVRRTYDSRDRAKDQDFGFGWSLDYQNIKTEESRRPGFGWAQETSGGLIPNICIEPLGPPIVTITLPDGDVETFEAAASPRCSQLFAQNNVTIVFNAVGDTQSTLAAVDGSAYYNDGNLLDDITSVGTENYADPDRYQLTTRAGFVYDLDQNLGIRSVVDPNGNTLTYSDEGIIHSDGKRVDFTRNAEGRIVKITAPSGKALNYAYEANGDLAGVTDRDGAETTFSYNLSHGLIDIMDPLGRNIVKNIYDDAGRLIAQEDDEGNRTEFDHDVDGRQSIITDRNGNITQLFYDDEGNVTTMVDALGNSTSYTHDINGNELSKTNSLGHETQATFNDRNDQLTQTDALGNVTAFEYNEKGSETKITDARGNEFNNTYDSNNNLASITDPLGNVAINTVNRQGLPTQVTDVLGNSTQFSYDVDGYKTSETDAEGNVMTYVNDDNGNVLTQTKTRIIAGTPTEETTTFEYDDRDRVIKTIDALGNETQTEYDLVGNEVAQIDALGRRTEMEYDAYKRLTQTTYPDGTTMLKTYDPEGNLLTDTDRLGRVTTYEYDQLNRLIKTTQADGSVTQTEYDAIGRVVAEIDANNNRTVHAYDAADRRISTTDALGNVTTFAYDADGNMTGMTDANGNTTTYVYNALDQKVQTTFQNASTMLEGLDALSRKTRMTDQAGVVTNYEYDKLGRLVKVIDALSQETSYTYDSVGNKLTQTDAEGRTTTWTYDALGRVVSRTLPLDQVETMRYDEVGNLIEHIDFKGQTTVHTYDVNNRLTQSMYADGLVEAFVYDALGNRTQANKTENSVITTTNYVYDNLNRLISETQFVGTADEVTLSYTYDAVGNRITLTEVQGAVTRITHYGFDALNRLQTVTDPEANVTTYQYDAVGNRIGMEHANGNKVSYVYDELNRLTTLNHLDSADAITQGFTYTLHPTGRRTKITEQSGRVTDYTYDTLYRLLTESIIDPINGDHNASYTYDKVGNRTFETVNGVSTAYTVDDNDRLVQQGGNLYTHDANGNTLTQTLDSVVTTYSYNAKNQLVGSNEAGSATAYLYNIDGIRIGKGDTLGQTLYTVDTNRSYAQVLSESSNGSVAVNYTYGDDLISQKRGADTSTYHYDGLGSTRALSDVTGNLTDTYDYEAFGEVLNQTGTTENSYLYTGEQFDATLDQYYLRARYYDQGIGRFTQMDTWMGVNSDPVTLHKYTYVHNDPANMIDPSGNITIGFSGFGGGISVTLAVPSYSSFVISANLTAIRLAGAAQFSALGAAGQRLLTNSGQNGINAMRQGLLSMARTGRTINADQARNSLYLTTNVGSKMNSILNFTRNPANTQYHHIVEKAANINRFGSRAINSVSNVVNIPTHVHRSITSFYARNRAIPQLNGQTLRSVISRASFRDQWRVGSEITAKALSNNGAGIQLNLLSAEAQQIIFTAARLP